MCLQVLDIFQTSGKQEYDDLEIIINIREDGRLQKGYN